MAQPRIKLPQLTPQDITRFWKKVDKTPGQGPHGECWQWTAYCNEDGYGRFELIGKAISATRVAYLIATGEDPYELCVLHHCDNPPCVRPTHLWKGTQADNAQDKILKGRDGSLSGDDHWMRKHPEKLVNLIRGDRHWTRKYPERVPRGDKHGSHLHPERMKRGDEHHTRKRPETLNPVHGEQHGRSKLTATIVLEIRAKYATGEYLQRELAVEYNCCQQHIGDIVTRKIWRHI